MSAPEPKSGPVSEAQRVAAQKSLLLVEDVRVSQRVARVALARARFRVDVAGDGQEAVDAFKKGKFDVILMDIQLPIMNGTEATRQIREIEAKENRDRVVIFGLTGSLSDSDLDTYKKAGMNGCIGKGNILEQAVPEALSEHEAKPDEFIVCRIGGLVSPGPALTRSLAPSHPTAPTSLGLGLSGHGGSHTGTSSSRMVSNRGLGLSGHQASSRSTSHSQLPQLAHPQPSTVTTQQSSSSSSSSSTSTSTSSSSSSSSSSSTTSTTNDSMQL